MERTSGMALSEDEKETFRKEEFQKKAKGLKLKLLEDPSRSDQILSEAQEESEANQRLLESLLWEQLINEMAPDKPLLQYLDLLEKLPHAGGLQEIFQEARDSFKAASKTSAKDKKKALARERKRLAAFGISGSAVVPKLPSSDSDASGNLAATVEAYKTRLLKEAPSVG